ncbi:hypothetical protein CCACVL1_18667 [Corchorus capsularis]|uniref:LOB domain-containing protein n=1 Tax=Corchorus capsularis TaxID=210143 RepID=A0A1R3HKA8_COCAP|nr:hypothetical protein CCACVL1_18667 [Corchorus capsularis]
MEQEQDPGRKQEPGGKKQQDPGRKKQEPRRRTCAVCKHNRRRCEEDCFFAKTYPTALDGQFSLINERYGHKSIKKMLVGTEPEMTLQTSVMEAQDREHYPVLGSYGWFDHVLQQNPQADSSFIRHLLWSKLQTPTIPTAAETPTTMKEIVPGPSEEELLAAPGELMRRATEKTKVQNKETKASSSPSALTLLQEVYDHDETGEDEDNPEETKALSLQEPTGLDSLTFALPNLLQEPEPVRLGDESEETIKKPKRKWTERWSDQV